MLTADGRLLCAIGCRRPLASLLALPHTAGCDSQWLLVTSTPQAIALEQALLPDAVDAEEALHLVEAGVPLGHTVAVLETTPHRLT
jgi:hypothetical protein